MFSNTIFGSKFGFIKGGSAPAPSFPYTDAFNTVVIARGGSLTTNEVIYLHTFETSLILELPKFDRLFIHGLSNQKAALTSFVNPSTTPATAVNFPLFTPSQGFTGNGVSTYLNLNYIASTDSVNFTLNSANAGYYGRIDIGANGGGEIGGYATTATPCYFYGITRYLSQTQYSYINNTNDLGSLIYYGTTQGLFSWQRTTATNTNALKNGILLGNNSAISGILPPISYYLMCLNTNNIPALFSTNQFSLSFLASGTVNQLNFYNAVQTLGTSIGWAI